MKFWNVPNTIGVIRVILIVIALPFMYFTPGLWLISVSLIALSFLLDGLDGYIARKLKQITTIGSLVDVLADRITEYLLWIFFSGVGIIPIWAPLIVIPRGAITDSIRAIANAKGISVYDLPKSNIAKALVKNRIPRLTIGLCKAVLFIISAVQVSGVYNLSDWIFWITVIVVLINLARGIPVILEAGQVMD